MKVSIGICLSILIYNGNWYCLYLIQYQWLLGIWLNKYWKLNYQISIPINTKSNQKVPKVRKEKRGIITPLISHFIGLVYEGIASFLHNRRHKALHKAVKAMEPKVNIEHKRLIQLEDSMVIYRVYDTETLERLVQTVH